MKFVALFFLGTLITEACGYFWHRSVSHAGLFKSVLSDLLRRRHYDHHEHKYPKPGIRHQDYASSCDVSFRVLGVLMVSSVLGAAALGAIGSLTALSFLLAIAFHAILGTQLHTLYHLPDERIKSSFWGRWGRSRQALFWLRDFHDIHHLVNANYSLCIPFFDVIGRSYVSPSRLSVLRREALFPGFDPKLSSSCDEPLI